MFEFIEADDIRVGDEVVGSSHGFATRFRVAHIDNGRLYAEQPGGSHSSSAFLWAHECKWSLLDRPAPAVDLPTEPTGGILTWLSGPRTEPAGESRSLFAVWKPSPCISRWPHRNGAEPATQMHADGLGLQVPMERVTAFTPAVAVPKAALDELIARGGHGFADLDLAIREFIAAIDAANGDPR